MVPFECSGCRRFPAPSPRSPICLRCSATSSRLSSVRPSLSPQPVRRLRHPFCGAPGPLGQWVADRLAVPNVLTVHGGDLYDPSKRMSPHRHALLRRTVRSYAESGRRHREFKQYGCQCVADLRGLPRRQYRAAGIERPATVVGASRVLSGFRKTPSSWSRSVDSSHASRRSTPGSRGAQWPEKSHLVVIGDGPEKNEVRRLAAELGIAARVHLLGFVSEEDKYRALSVADVFVSASQTRGSA